MIKLSKIMEYIDIYNSDGKPLGIKKSREEAHNKGLWHKGVHIWIINSKGEILIQKRSPNVANHPNKWDISAAGHISAGEDDIAAAIKETKEEIGLSLSSEDFKHIGTVRKMSSREGYVNNEINPVYIVRMDLDPSKIKKQKEEVSEVKFVSHKELQGLIGINDQSFVPHPEEYNLLFRFLEENKI